MTRYRCLHPPSLSESGAISLSAKGRDYIESEAGRHGFASPALKRRLSQQTGVQIEEVVAHLTDWRAKVKSKMLQEDKESQSVFTSLCNARSRTVTESGYTDFPTVPGRVLGKMITRYISGGFKEVSDVEAMATLERVTVVTMWEWYNHRARQDETGLGGALGNPSPMPARVVRPVVAATEVPVLQDDNEGDTFAAPGDMKEEDELDGDGSDMELSTPDSQTTRDASPEVPLSRLSNTQLFKEESPSLSERLFARSSTERPTDLKTEGREDTPRTPMQSRVPSPPFPITPGGAQDDDEFASPVNGVPGVFFAFGSNKPPQLITLPPGFDVLDGPAFAAHAIASSLQATMRSSAFDGRITSQAGVGAHRTETPASKRQRPYTAVTRKVSDGVEGTDHARLQVGQAGPSRPKVLRHLMGLKETARQDDSDDDVVEVEKDSKGKWVPVTTRNTQARASEDL